MIERLGEFLNTEIVNETVINLKNAIEWLERTYFSLWLHKNPEYYNLEIKNSDKFIEEIFLYKLNLIHTALIDLDVKGCITYKRSEGTF